jgi:hypothetical protein
MGFKARLLLPLTVALAAGLTLISCGEQGSPTGPTSGAPPTTFSGGSPLLIGAGDIGDCGAPGAEATARLLDRYQGTVFTAGDNAYPAGGAEEYRNCYEPTWGRHRGRTRPTPGNHEYMSGAGGYFGYFGASAGQPGEGYYSYTVGSWRIYALNSELPSGPGSPQQTWLRNELSAHRTTCSAAIWHRPLFSSGGHGNNPDMRELWRILVEFGVDLVINGHDHTYERFAPQDPDGRPDAARGIRQFVVGTGGAPLYSFIGMQPTSEVRAAVWGIAVFTLNAGSYQWQFVPVDGEGFRDMGSDVCH